MGLEEQRKQTLLSSSSAQGESTMSTTTHAGASLARGLLMKQEAASKSSQRVGWRDKLMLVRNVLEIYVYKGSSKSSWEMHVIKITTYAWRHHLASVCIYLLILPFL